MYTYLNMCGEHLKIIKIMFRKKKINHSFILEELTIKKYENLYIVFVNYKQDYYRDRHYGSNDIIWNSRKIC